MGEGDEHLVVLFLSDCSLWNLHHNVEANNLKHLCCVCYECQLVGWEFWTYFQGYVLLHNSMTVALTGLPPEANWDRFGALDTCSPGSTAQPCCKDQPFVRAERANHCFFLNVCYHSSWMKKLSWFRLEFLPLGSTVRCF